MDLRPHQLRMVEFATRYAWSLNSSEMGTGKTRAAIESVLRKGGVARVVCPSFLVPTWRAEIEKWAPKSQGSFHIVPYSGVVSKLFALNGFDWVILDEAHYICNPEAKRTANVLGQLLAYRPKNVLLLTGTPVRNRVPELWTLLWVLDLYHNRGFREIFPTRYVFSDYFCYRNVRHFKKGTSVTYSGLKNEDVLREWLLPVSIQITTEEIGDLPPLIFETVVCPKDSPELDQYLENAFGEKIVLAHNAQQKVQNAMLKVDTTVSTVENLLVSGRGPVVVFSDHISSAEAIYHRLPRKYRIQLVTGESPPPSKRQEIAERFQAGEFDVLIATVGSLNTGVTLTVASVMVFNDFNWTPGENRQAIYRFYRLGQTKPCTIYVVARRGVDQRIVDRLTSKMETISKIRGFHDAHD